MDFQMGMIVVIVFVRLLALWLVFYIIQLGQWY